MVATPQWKAALARKVGKVMLAMEVGQVAEPKPEANKMAKELAMKREAAVAKAKSHEDAALAKALVVSAVAAVAKQKADAEAEARKEHQRVAAVWKTTAAAAAAQRRASEEIAARKRTSEASLIIAAVPALAKKKADAEAKAHAEALAAWKTTATAAADRKRAMDEAAAQKRAAQVALITPAVPSLARQADEEAWAKALPVLPSALIKAAVEKASTAESWMARGLRARLVGQQEAGTEQAFTSYRIEVTADGGKPCGEVTRRYSEFRALDDVLRPGLGADLPTLPPKSFFFRKSVLPDFGSRREQGLAQLLEAMVAAAPEHPALLEFLGVSGGDGQEDYEAEVNAKEWAFECVDMCSKALEVFKRHIERHIERPALLAQRKGLYDSQENLLPFI